MIDLDVKPKSVRELIDHNLLVRKRDAHEILDRFRNSLVVRSLKLSNGNIRQAARMLQVSDRIMKQWMRAAGIDRYYNE